MTRHADDALIYRAATDLAAAIRTKQVSSEDLVLAHLDRIEAVNPLDGIVCPVESCPAPRHAETAGTSPEGLPIGVQVVARPWRENVALRLAQHIEAALGGWRRPAL